MRQNLLIPGKIEQLRYLSYFLFLGTKLDNYGTRPEIGTTLANIQSGWPYSGNRTYKDRTNPVCSTYSGVGLYRRDSIELPTSARTQVLDLKLSSSSFDTNCKRVLKILVSFMSMSCTLYLVIIFTWEAPWSMAVWKLTLSWSLTEKLPVELDISAVCLAWLAIVSWSCLLFRTSCWLTYVDNAIITVTGLNFNLTC